MFEMSKPLLSFLVFIVLTFVTACDRGRERTNVVTGDGQPEVTVMDFSAPFSLDPLPAGWYHRTFWTRGPMQTAFAVKDGVPALRFETRSTASMLFRHVETPELHCRFRWQPRSVAFWDNRAVQHHAMWDYYPQRRHGHRVTIKGDAPFYRP